MTRTLTINQNHLSYFAQLSKPKMSLLGNQQHTIDALYDVFSEYRVELSSFQLEGTGSNPSSIGVNVNLGTFGFYKVKADRIEWLAENFGEEVIEKFPNILQCGSEWLRSALNISFKSHYFAYICHGRLSEGDAEQFLLTLPVTRLFGFGRSLGNGIIETWFDDTLGGTGKLWIDHSISIKGGLYVQLLIAIEGDEVDYFKVTKRGIDVFYGGLRSIGIEVEREVPFEDDKHDA